MLSVLSVHGFFSLIADVEDLVLCCGARVVDSLTADLSDAVILTPHINMEDAHEKDLRYYESKLL
jgi:hypothetical protein